MHKALKAMKGAEGQKAPSMTPEALAVAQIAMAERNVVIAIAQSAAATLDAALHDKTMRICLPRYSEDEDKDALVNPPAPRRSTRKRNQSEPQSPEGAKRSKKTDGEDLSGGEE